MPPPCLTRVSTACCLPSLFLESPCRLAFAQRARGAFDAGPKFPLHEGRGAFDAGAKFSQGRGQRGEGRTGILEEQEEATSIRGWDQERYTLVVSLSQLHHDVRGKCWIWGDTGTCAGPKTYSTIDTLGRFLNAQHGTVGMTMYIFQVLCRSGEITWGQGEMWGPGQGSPLAMSSLYAQESRGLARDFYSMTVPSGSQLNQTHLQPGH